jgi:hypothetical protein
MNEFPDHATSKTITGEVVNGYLQCPRKGFLLLWSREPGAPHGYELAIGDQRNSNLRDYFNSFQRKEIGPIAFSVEGFRDNSEVLKEAVLNSPVASSCHFKARI